MSSPNSHGEESKGYSPHMHGVALGILVMGVSLAVVIILWIEFGYIGPAFSTQIMQQQQESLRKQYGLPPEPTLSTETLEVPPSLRNIAASTNASSTGTNASSTGTTVNATGTNTTNAGGDTSVSIVSGASSLTNTAYDPTPVQVKVGSKVTW